MTVASMARAWGELGDLQKKRELLEEAEPILESRLGKSHKVVKEVAKQLADTYSQLGENTKRKLLMERVFHRREYGPRH